MDEFTFFAEEVAGHNFAIHNVGGMRHSVNHLKV
jgi:hypothetical protein